MNLTDNLFLLFLVVIVGVVAQQVLAQLKKREIEPAYTIVRMAVLIYWICLGLAMIIGGTAQLSQGYLIIGTSCIALGLGLMLSGLGQTLERRLIKTIGVVVLAIGPIVAGISFVASNNQLAGTISLAMGLGILISAAKGWIGGIGQMVLGAVILGSSAMLLIGTLITATRQVDWVTVVIGAAMLAMGAWIIINGAITLIGTIKQSSKVALPSS